MKISTNRILKCCCAVASGFFLLSPTGVKEIDAFSVASSSFLFSSSYSIRSHWTPRPLMMSESDNSSINKPAPDENLAGSFFHQIPPSDDKASSADENDEKTDSISYGKENEVEVTSGTDDFDDEISKLLQQRRKRPLASRPSTINGVPTEKATGFGKPKKGVSSSKKTGGKNSQRKSKPISPYLAIGPPDQPINDPSKPERDDQGYTIYTDTRTGEKSRVFEALVDYPSIFTMKIVGANEGAFVADIVALVAEACETEVTEVKHSTKVIGKWVSVTVKAPVESADMLYSLYEKVDLDPRVKFKF